MTKFDHDHYEGLLKGPIFDPFDGMVYKTIPDLKKALAARF